jgi:hypothetical protein
MNRTIERLKLIFLGIFAVANVGMLVWQVGWAWPEQKCTEAKKWWDGSQRVCAQPILISDITGRVIADPKARAEAMKALGRTPPAEAPAPAAPEPNKP